MRRLARATILTAAMTATLGALAGTASAQCPIPLPGDPPPPPSSCLTVNTGVGSNGSGSPVPIVMWASGYDVNPIDGKRGGIWISRFDGTGRRQITQFTDHHRDFEPHGLNLPDDHPSFSPDYRHIVFTSNRANGTDWDIWEVDVNGANMHLLNSAPGIDSEPVFSPDGTKIAFETQRFGNTDIAVMNADGTNVRRITTNPLEDIEPAWSPDGTKLAFARVQSPTEKDVFIVNADGTSERQLTFAPGQDHDPTWSPDGSRLVITSERPKFSPPFGNIHVIRVSDGADLGDLTSDLKNGAADPFWGVDNEIAFFKSTFPFLGPTELYVMNDDGTGKLRIPGEASVNVHPAIGLAVDDDHNGTPNYLESGSVGTASLIPRSLRAGSESLLHFSWTDPRAWRELTTLYIGFADGKRTLGIVRHAVAQRSFSLYDLARRQYGAAKALGHGALRYGALTVDLRASRIVHISKKTLRLDLAVLIQRGLAGHRLRVGVQALDSRSRNQAQHLGSLRLTR
jgi:Tol biopolymer transport system component